MLEKKTKSVGELEKFIVGPREPVNSCLHRMGLDGSRLPDLAES